MVYIYTYTIKTNLRNQIYYYYYYERLIFNFFFMLHRKDKQIDI